MATLLYRPKVSSPLASEAGILSNEYRKYRRGVQYQRRQLIMILVICCFLSGCIYGMHYIITHPEFNKIMDLHSTDQNVLLYSQY